MGDDPFARAVRSDVSKSSARWYATQRKKVVLPEPGEPRTMATGFPGKKL